jgi:hypothetical protein
LGPEQAEHRPGGHGHGQAVEGLDVAERDGDVVDLDGRVPLVGHVVLLRVRLCSRHSCSSTGIRSCHQA